MSSKLIRDKIPGIINNGKCYRADSFEFGFRLREKLIEEVSEYLISLELEELGDILEVIYALAEFNGYTKTELEKVRLDKLEKKGGFKDRTIWRK